MPSSRTNRTITGIPGIRVGHAESPEAESGVTAILFDRPATTVIDIRGGASATYDTGSLAVDATFGQRWALFFSGGSLYGLDAARGIRTWVLESGGGHHVFQSPHIVAPISGAALFDLPSRPGLLPDYLPLGYEAARSASSDPVGLGRRGAGRGATVGKYRGRAYAMHGGIGSLGRSLFEDLWVGALVAVNAVGAVRDLAEGRWVAGARNRVGRIAPPSPRGTYRARGTTLALVATNASLSRAQLQRVATLVGSGLARVIVPYNTSTDGDVTFVASTGSLPEVAHGTSESIRLVDRIGTAGADLAAESAVQAVRLANR